MREIKFRGFHPCEDGSKTIALNGSKIKGIWLYGSLLNNVFFNAETEEPMFYIIDTREVNYNDNYNEWIFLWDSGAKRFEVIPETIGQFTGLCDKNGVEIYEGDIVKYNDRETAEVTYQLCEYTLVFKSQAVPQRGLLCESWKNNFEVIGNIHERKEEK